MDIPAFFLAKIAQGGKRITLQVMIKAIGLALIFLTGGCTYVIEGHALPGEDGGAAASSVAVEDEPDAGPKALLVPDAAAGEDAGKVAEDAGSSTPDAAPVEAAPQKPWCKRDNGWAGQCIPDGAVSWVGTPFDCVDDAGAPYAPPGCWLDAKFPSGFAACCPVGVIANEGR